MLNAPNHLSFSWANLLAVKSPLFELFIGGIQDLYWAENHLVRTLLKLRNACGSRQLQHAINDYLELTKQHALRLEQIFELLDEKIDARKCDAMDGLCREAEEMLEYTAEGSSTRDAGIILVSEKIGCYEIACYEGLIKLSRVIGRDDVAELLAISVAEEKECNTSLNGVTEVILHKAHTES